MTTTGMNFGIVRFAVFLLALVASAGTFAQKPAAKAVEPQRQLILAVSEGGAGNVDAFEISTRYESFKQVIEKALGRPIILVAVRDIKVLRQSVETGAYALVISRPADILAEAIRDYGYQAVVASKESARALFIVLKDSPLTTIADIKGKRIVTPDRYAYMWRIANAMMREAGVPMAKEQVRIMRDQAAIEWSLEKGFFDVGVVASYSGVGRNWEKKGGRVIARSREVPNTPLIASSKLSAVQVEKIRSALIALNSSEGGAAILKQIGVIGGFRETSRAEFLDMLTWLGKLEMAKQ